MSTDAAVAKLFGVDGCPVVADAYFPIEWGFAESDGIGGPAPAPQALYVTVGDGNILDLAARLDLFVIVDAFIDSIQSIDESTPEGFIHGDHANDAASLRDVFLECAKRIADKLPPAADDAIAAFNRADAGVVA